MYCTVFPDRLFGMNGTAIMGGVEKREGVVLSQQKFDGLKLNPNLNLSPSR